MGTRESTRQELRDLAKLAATMPKERPTPTPVATAPLQRPTLQRPPTPSSISKLTVPPAIASIPPASRTLEPPTSRKGGGRGVLMTSIVLGLAVAVGGGVTLGRTLAHRTPPAAAASDAKVVSFGTPAAAPPPATAAAPLPAPAPVPVAAAATATATAAAVPATATAATVTTAAPKPAAAARRYWPRPAAAKPAANVPASTSGGAKDSLDEAIRRAVASP
jgi:hypothetical protein